MDIERRKNREIILLQILYLYVIPTLLLYFDVIPDKFRFLMLLTIALTMYGIVRKAHWTSLDLGVEKSFMKDIFPYVVFTVCGVLFLVWLAQITPHARMLEWWENRRFLLLFIPFSILQEIIFRGVLMHLLKRAFTSLTFVIVVNATVFSFMHVIYTHSIFVLPVTFIGGIGFAWIYDRYPNLILISASHTILNFVAMILGFFVLR